MNARTALPLGLLLALAAAAARRGPASEVLWLSDGARAAFEPALACDDAGRLWVAWIACGDGARPEVSVEGACVADGRVLGRFALADAALPAAPALAGTERGAYLVVEEGAPGARRLVGRALALGAAGVEPGAPEVLVADDGGGRGTPLAPRLARTGDGLAAVWQGLAGDQYDVFLARRGADGWSAPRALAATPRDEWAPRVAALADGALAVAYDAWSGTSFDVLLRRVAGDDVGPPVAVAASADHEACADVAADGAGGAWVVWEEAASFGEGPGLRSERGAAVARVADGRVERAARLPRRVKRRDLPRAAAGAEGLLVTYRTPVRADVRRDHLFTSWLTGVARFADGAPEEETLEPTDGNNDAEQDLALDGRGRAWMAFAADDRRAGFPKAGEWGEPIEGRWRVGLVELGAPRGFPAAAAEPPPPLRSAPPVAPPARGAADGVLFGDLHRHTHLSRCSGAQDGTAADAYRYARGPGGLDFVAITDHWQHLRPWSWWRSARDVARYDAPGSLAVLPGVERVRGGKGHFNDVYRDPLAVAFDTEAWRRPPSSSAPVPEGDVISIPHMMGIGGDTGFRWEEHAEPRTRLYEVFQGTRGSYEGPGLPYESDDGAEAETSVAAGLARGLRFGLIASSDHVSSRTAFAGVRCAEVTRGAVFAALFERHAFGATDARPVLARAGALEGGDAGAAGSGARYALELLPGARTGVAYAELLRDGEVVERRAGTGAAEGFVLSPRAGLLRARGELLVSAPGGSIGAFGQRLAGETAVAAERRGDAALALSQTDLGAADVWLQAVLPGGALELSLGDARERVALAELAPGRSRRVRVGDVELLVWRQGPPLAAPGEATPGGPAPGVELERIEFDTPLAAGASWHARVAWTDGNLAWTSPVFPEAATPAAEGGR